MTRSLMERTKRLGAKLAPSLGGARGRQASSKVAADEQAPDGMQRYMIGGVTVVVLLVGGLGGWAASSELAGAVLAGGTVVVDSNVKKVQHAAGGIIGEIGVRDGDTVLAGDVLIRLDETVTRANLQVLTKQLDELGVRQARLKAERDGAEMISLPRILAEREAEPAVAEMIAGERSLFDSRRSARASQKLQLRERIAQLGEEVRGLTAQHEAKGKEVDLLRRELAGLEQLESKQLVPTTKMTVTRRDLARLEGERAHFIAAAAQTKGKIAEIELQLLQLDQDLRTEVVKELREAQNREAELVERKAAAEDQLKRIDIRAPQAGIVHQLAVHTRGGVVIAGEPLMLIVPEGDRLVIEARVLPQDIDQVRVGLPAFLRFSAFNQRTTPERTGLVERVSADLTRESATGVAYYIARIVLSEPEIERLGTLRLVPGMPVDVQIKTAERSALSYFVKPLQDQFARAFRER